MALRRISPAGGPWNAPRLVHGEPGFLTGVMKMLLTEQSGCHSVVKIMGKARLGKFVLHGHTGCCMQEHMRISV